MHGAITQYGPLLLIFAGAQVVNHKLLAVLLTQQKATLKGIPNCHALQGGVRVELFSKLGDVRPALDHLQF